MERARTGAERYFQKRLEDPEYHDTYEHARSRIDQIDRIIAALDERRSELALSKAELARLADIPPEAIRRLFSASRPNPTLKTLAAIADALDVDLLSVPRQSRASGARPTSPTQSDASGTRRRTA